MGNPDKNSVCIQVGMGSMYDRLILAGYIPSTTLGEVASFTLPYEAVSVVPEVNLFLGSVVPYLDKEELSEESVSAAIGESLGWLSSIRAGLLEILTLYARRFGELPREWVYVFMGCQKDAYGCVRFLEELLGGKWVLSLDFTKYKRVENH